MSEVKRIYLLGSGGHAKVIIDCMRELNIRIYGILDSNKSKHGTEYLGVTILGSDDSLHGFSESSRGSLIVIGIGSTRTAEIRHSIYKSFKDQNFKFLNIIHPKSIISSFASIGESVQVLAGAIINAGTVIGDNAIVNTGSVIDHDCLIGQSVHVAPGVTLSGNVKVGNNSLIGTGSKIIQGVEIGRDCLIGAGAVVISDIPDNSLAVGCPARVLKKI